MNNLKKTNSTLIYLIRHGNKPHIAGDPSLSALGIKQAKETASYFINKDITKIYSSPFKRTKKTAQIIADELNIKNITFDKRLKERFNWGDDPSYTFEQFIAEWKKTTTDRDYTPNIGDSSRSSGQRLKCFIDEAIATDQENNILLVLHGGVIMDLLRNLFDDDYLKSFSPNFLNSGIGDCSITKLSIQNNTYTLQDFDFVKHLSKSLQIRSSDW